MRKVAALFGIFLAMFALYVLQKSLPTYGDITSPIAISGKVGEKLSARNFELTVTQLRFARTVKLAAFGSERSYGTSGIWALVEAEAAARNETVALTSATWLGADGLRYLASERVGNAPGLLGRQRLEPGLPQRVLMIFEFPESEVSKGTLLVARSPFQPLDNELHIAMEPSAAPLIHDLVTLERGRSDSDWSVEAK
jgi:hypothetical protein